jgi:outer membrane protein TolC
MRRIALTCAFVLASVLSAFAAETPPVLTLDQALMRVRSAGFDIRMARADAASARADADTAGAALRPQVGISAN